MNRLSRLAILPLLVAGLAACITDPVTGESSVGVPISESEEAAMGASYKPLIIQQYGGPYPDPALRAHLEPLVMSIAQRSERPGLPWTFTILNTSIPNAFAVPGGPVFVTRGLLVRLVDEAEFVVVMGHEIGHVEHRHSVRSMGRAALLQGAAGLGSVLSGSDLVGQLIVAGGGIFVLPAYSRDAERESDVRGVVHSYGLQYDPRQGADVFRMFQQLKEEAGGSDPSGLAAWTSTHPLDEERIDNVLALSAKTDARFAGDDPVAGYRVTTTTWASLVAKLQRDQEVYDRYDEAADTAVRAAKNGNQNALRRSLTTFEACDRDLPRHAQFAAAIGWIHLNLGDNVQARSHLERAAAMNQQILEPEMLLAELDLGDGRYDDTIRRANRGLELLPESYNYPCLFLRAEAHRAKGNTARAEADYRKVLDIAPEDSPEYQESAKHVTVEKAPEPAEEPPKKKRRKGRKKKARR